MSVQKVTLNEIYQNGKMQLTKAGIESPAFDAVCLLEAVFGLDRQGLIVHGGEAADAGKTRLFQEKIRQRVQKRPLQYILGEWPFLSLRLKTGEGVLIPREDTEVLVRTAAELLQNHERPQVLDLCAGTGAVGLGLASLLPQAGVTCVEWMDPALRYLKENIEAYRDAFPQVSCIQADVLNPDTPKQFDRVDGILSNPPYIETEELPALQDEVRQEPATALDGGPDGLIFYRALAVHWISRLNPGGILAVEVGENQAGAVQALFAEAGLTSLCRVPDLNGIDRVVAGILK